MKTCGGNGTGSSSRQTAALLLRSGSPTGTGASHFSRGRSRVSRVTRYPLSHWADDIMKAWGRGAANTLALAKIVSQARRSLAFGEWSDLWRLGKMPFSKRKADMLKAIGEGVEN